MPDIAASTIYPSLKFIATDASGNLEEVESIAASEARVSINGVLFKAKQAGVAGDNITIEITENTAAGADAVTVTGNDILIAFDGVASDSSTVDLKDLVVAEPAAHALISIAGASSSNPAFTSSKTNLANGSEFSAGELDASSNYLLIKQADLYDLADDEQTDGRKVVWGLIDKAATAFAGMSAQPDNLKITKSVPTSTDSGTSLKQSYTITAKYALSGLDLKAES